MAQPAQIGTRHCRNHDPSKFPAAVVRVSAECANRTVNRRNKCKQLLKYRRLARPENVTSTVTFFARTPLLGRLLYGSPAGSKRDLPLRAAW